MAAWKVNFSLNSIQLHEAHAYLHLIDHNTHIYEVKALCQSTTDLLSTFIVLLEDVRDQL